jgi:hypothetical protein
MDLWGMRPEQIRKAADMKAASIGARVVRVHGIRSGLWVAVEMVHVIPCGCGVFTEMLYDHDVNAMLRTERAS